MSNQVGPATPSRPTVDALPISGETTDGSVSSRHRWATLAVLCVTLLLISLDNTVLNVALPSIVRSLGASSSQLQWMVDAYAVVFAGLLLSLGALGDRAGRKWVFMGGLVVFGGGSAFATWSGSPDRLTLARAVMGIGAAALMPCTLSILTNVFTQEKERVRAIGIWSGATGLGVALGPILGGILLAHYWWGSVFLVNVPVAILGLIAAIWLVPNSRNPASTRPDPIGAVLSILGGGSLLWGIIEAPSRGWSSPLILGAIGAAAILIAAFVVWERRIDHPMLPLRFFASRRYSVAIAALALVLFALLGMFFVMTQYLQFVLGYSPLEAGVRIAPVALALLVIAPLSVLAAHRFGSKLVIVSGMALIALGLGLLSRTTVAGTYRDCIAAFLVLGVGVALALAPSTESVMGSLPKEEAGVGSATNDTAMQLGGALGVGVLGTALILRYQHLVSPVVAHAGVPASVQGLINSSLGAALAVAQHAPPALGNQLALLARRSFVSGMDLALMIATGVVAVAAVLVLVLLPNQGSGSAAVEVPEAIV
ncbi:MAG TPA: DHA2 family efflux MFS transporter permease subunit [Acidimicrobiales bacterium]|jgi:EmrB/QacA subfamily drug resistance transporter